MFVFYDIIYYIYMLYYIYRDMFLFIYIYIIYIYISTLCPGLLVAAIMAVLSCRSHVESSRLFLMHHLEGPFRKPSKYS